jgi:hypothetical protein
LFNRYDRHYNNAILLQLSNFYQKKNNKVITYNAFDILQKSFLSTDNRGGGGGTKGPNKGNRGGQGRRGPNQRVPNNPGQNRGKKKGGGGGKGGNQPRMNSFYQKNNNNNNKKKSRITWSRTRRERKQPQRQATTNTIVVESRCIRCQWKVDCTFST